MWFHEDKDIAKVLLHKIVRSFLKIRIHSTQGRINTVVRLKDSTNAFGVTKNSVRKHLKLYLPAFIWRPGSHLNVFCKNRTGLPYCKLTECLRTSQPTTFKVRLAIFHHYAWKGQYNKTTYRSRYSRMDQVRFVEDSL